MYCVHFTVLIIIVSFFFVVAKMFCYNFEKNFRRERIVEKYQQLFNTFNKKQKWDKYIVNYGTIRNEKINIWPDGGSNFWSCYWIIFIAVVNSSCDNLSRHCVFKYFKYYRELHHIDVYVNGTGFLHHVKRFEYVFIITRCFSTGKS